MSIKKISVVLGVLCVALISVAAFALLRTPAEASEPVQAIPLDEETQGVLSESSTESGSTAEAAAESLFEIDSSQSQVQFAIDEVLRGSPFTAVGTSDQVAGQISFDPADLSSTQVGVIQVNARTLATDDNFRNRAIQNQILDTGQYEFITFTPTAIEGLPDSVSVGDTVTFSIVGDLTIRDVTQEVVFDVAVTLASESELQGAAQATILRSDFGLTIPSVQQVAEVSDELSLTLDFVATAV